MTGKKKSTSRKKAARKGASRSVHLHAPSSEPETVLDACDLKLEEADATLDEDLPAAEGGVG